jgi:hypothetical protein
VTLQACRLACICRFTCLQRHHMEHPSHSKQSVAVATAAVRLLLMPCQHAQLVKCPFRQTVLSSCCRLSRRVWAQHFCA